MFDFLKRKSETWGSVYFRGSLAPRLEEFGDLEKHGVEVQPGPDRDDVHWMARLTHPDWGEAELISMRDRFPLPPRELLAYDARLSEEEAELIGNAGCALQVRHFGKKEFILRDRKHALRFMHAIMGDDGLAVGDHTAQSFWSGDALNDEMSHDADLDVEGLFTVHAVSADDQPAGDDERAPITWLHTHGLGELGAFDFDILRPHSDVVDQHDPLCRALAFAIIEGRLKQNATAYKLAVPTGTVRAIPADQFMRLAKPAETALRDDPEGDHRSNRVVLCEPSRGMFARWSRRVKPSRWLRRPIEGEMMFLFSNEASALMAERARNTYSMFRAAAAELAEFEFPTLVKLGLVVDGGGPDDKEHMWFAMQEAHDDHIRGELVNEPFDVARLKQGDVDDFPIDLISDWTILTPAGHITPRTTRPLRTICANWDKLKEAMEEYRKEQFGEV